MSELGNKHECLGCSTKFYDLGKSELVCPKCGENQKDLAAAQELAGNEKKRKKPAKKKAKKKAKAKADSTEKTTAAGVAKESDKESKDDAKG